MNSRITFPVFAVLLLALPLSSQEKKDETALKASTFSAMKLRTIGPAITSGRVVDIVVDPTDERHWYLATASAGVWETRNAGTEWKSIFDRQGSYSTGCITIDPSDPLTIWVGSGENNSQRSASYGDGLYKSTDGGRTWKIVGLESSEHIGKILVDPRDGDRVIVAAQGPLWSSGGDRGLYLTEDGGETWERTLGFDEHTGVNDVVMDPANPDMLYASSYLRQRRVYTLIHGGKGVGVHKSLDGGKTWNKLGGGLPGGTVGRIGLATAPSAPNMVYAIVEASSGGGFYRSTDAGGSWQKRSSYVSGSPQYYQEIFVDPEDPDRLYSMDVRMQRSEDGGKTWNGIGESSKHVDNHALWIDPRDTRHILAGCDGGLYESFDRASTWNFFGNLPITQFYRAVADNDFPFYNVYGGTQDNFSLGAPARSTSSNGITNREWFVTRGGDGFQSVVDPEDPDVIYAESQFGGLARFDKNSGVGVDIKPMAGPDEEPLRWNWNAPVMISPHAHTRLYFAANYLFRSDDRGNSWQKVSGNLSKQLDRNQLEVMGKIWSPDALDKDRSTSVYGNVVALTESPIQEGLLWVGSDDGRVQMTRDGGSTWQHFDEFPGVPEMTYVSVLRASHHIPERVYAGFDNHKRGDFKPYLLKSDDGGRSWSSIVTGLPDRGSVHTVAEDHIDPDLLFVGTEFGLYFSVDAGAKWIKLSGGMPTIAVRDLDIQRRENDLVVATFGRGIYILDDYSPLRNLSEASFAGVAKMFPVKHAWQFMESRPLGRGAKGFLGDRFYRAANPDVGAVFTYHVRDSLQTLKKTRQLAEASARKNGETPAYPTWDELRAEDRETKPKHLLVVRDASGSVVRRINASSSKGLHRLTWNLRAAAPGGGGRGGRGGGRSPMVPPGTYSVSLASMIDGQLSKLTGREEFVVERLPGSKFPAADPHAVYSFQQEVVSLNQEVQSATRGLSEATTRLGEIDSKLLNLAEVDPTWLVDAHALRNQLANLRVRMQGDRSISSRYGAQLPSISQRMRNAMGSFGHTSEPTQTNRDNLAITRALLGTVLEELRRLSEQDLVTLEAHIVAAGGPTPRGKLPGEKR